MRIIELFENREIPRLVVSKLGTNIIELYRQLDAALEKTDHVKRFPLVAAGIKARWFATHWTGEGQETTKSRYKRESGIGRWLHQISRRPDLSKQLPLLKELTSLQHRPKTFDQLLERGILSALKQLGDVLDDQELKDRVDHWIKLEEQFTDKFESYLAREEAGWSSDTSAKSKKSSSQQPTGPSIKGQQQDAAQKILNDVLSKIKNSEIRAHIRDKLRRVDTSERFRELEKLLKYYNAELEESLSKRY